MRVLPVIPVIIVFKVSPVMLVLMVIAVILMMPVIAVIPYSGKLSREKTCADR